MVQPLRKTAWFFLTKLNIPSSRDSATVFLGICPKELKTYVTQKPAHSCMFTAALLIMAKTWKKPRCPSAGEWINKLWYTQTLEYYSALKRSELSSHEETWRNLKWILPSDRGPSEELHTE